MSALGRLVPVAGAEAAPAVPCWVGARRHAQSGLLWGFCPQSLLSPCGMVSGGVGEELSPFPVRGARSRRAATCQGLGGLRCPRVEGSSCPACLSQSKTSRKKSVKQFPVWVPGAIGILREFSRRGNVLLGAAEAFRALLLSAEQLWRSRGSAGRGNFVRIAGRLIYFSSFWLTSGVPSEPFCGPVRPGVGRAPLPTALQGRESRVVVLGEPAGKALGRAQPNAAQRSVHRAQLRLSGSQSCSLRGP